MSGKDNLVRRVEAGKIIKPWLVLGPYYLNISGRVRELTLLGKEKSETGPIVRNEIIEEAKPILLSRPYEGERVSFRGETHCWSLLRRPEKYISWGEYSSTPGLGVTFLTTLITSEHKGTTHFRLVTGISSEKWSVLFAGIRVFVVLNGKVIYDTDGHSPGAKDDIFEHSFRAGLQRGDNLLTVAMFGLGSHNRTGCQLEVADQTVDVHVPLAEAASLEMRSQVEAEIAGLRLERDIFYPEHGVRITLSKAPSLKVPMKIQLVSQNGSVVVETQPTKEGPAILCQAGDLTDGRYKLICLWEESNGKPITSVAYDIYKLIPTSPLVGYEHMEKRKRVTLEHFARSLDLLEGGKYQPDIWAQVARYALGQYEKVDEGVIRDTCEFINARRDCSDFVIQGILRLMYWEREKQQLSSKISVLMKDTVLGFKYWIDEPGEVTMCMHTENHRLLFHVAEWLAGQLFPTEEFVNSRQRGLYHATKGRMYITEWLRQRGRFGFDEWHSNGYYPVNIGPLVNVYDFVIKGGSDSGDKKLKMMVGAILDYMFFTLAADTFHGIFGSTHGRGYAIHTKYPDFEGTAATCWLMYGEGSLWGGGSGMAPVSLATSTYELPRMFAKIAIDHSTVVESRQRQGILEGRLYPKGKNQSANFIVYRTPDYLLSGVQDHWKGEFEPQVHAAQVTLGNKVVIFWTCPHTSGEGSGQIPDYWSGSTSLPRVIQHRNVLALTYRRSESSWMTHCFFEQSRFDEVRFAGSWTFARVNHGYVGIYSQHGTVVSDYGQYAGRELICDAPENTWMVECGRKADWSSFEAFVKALKGARIEANKGVLTYFSPSIGRFITGWEVVPMVKDIPIQICGYPLVGSVWADSDFGSGEMILRYGDEKKEIWFNH